MRDLLKFRVARFGVSLGSRGFINEIWAAVAFGILVLLLVSRIAREEKQESRTTRPSTAAVATSGRNEVHCERGAHAMSVSADSTETVKRQLELSDHHAGNGGLSNLPV